MFGGVIMTELELLLDDIEELRSVLLKLIDDKDDLSDVEVMTASQELNQAIVKYHKLLIQKIC